MSWLGVEPQYLPDNYNYQFGDITRTVTGGALRDLGMSGDLSDRQKELLNSHNQSGDATGLSSNVGGSVINKISNGASPYIQALTGGASALNAITGLGESLGLWKSPQTKLAEQNFKLQKEQYEYSKALQREIFEREDNAIQRRASDLERAGLSKTLASGSGANAGAVVNTTAPQKQGISTDLQRSARIQQSLDSLATAMNLKHMSLQNELLDEQIKNQVVSNKVANLNYKWYSADKIAGYIQNALGLGLSYYKARSLAQNATSYATSVAKPYPIRPTQMGYVDTWRPVGKGKYNKMRTYYYD